MATKALGKENVLSVIMPCNSNSNDMQDAKAVVEKFEVKSIEVNLSGGYNGVENEIEAKLQTIGKTLSSEAKINMKPRFRMLTLYSIARLFRISSNRNRKLM